MAEGFLDFFFRTTVERFEILERLRGQADLSHWSSPKASLNERTFPALASLSPCSKAFTAFGLDMNSSVSTQLSNSSALITPAFVPFRTYKLYAISHTLFAEPTIPPSRGR